MSPLISESQTRSSFPRDVRLLTPADFKRVFQKPNKLRSASFTVYYRPNALGYARLGLAVSKKHAKLAVTRNRIKRLIRESFRHQRHSLPGIDVIVMISPHTADRDNQSIRHGLDNIWKRLADVS